MKTRTPAYGTTWNATSLAWSPMAIPCSEHVDEGTDDMPAHVRSILTQTSITIPVARARCDLGTWQGIYLWEHRTAPHQRRITISVVG